MWGSPWVVFPPRPFFFRMLLVFLPGLPGGEPSSVVGGGGLWVCLSVLSCCSSLPVAVACSGRGPPGPSPPPLLLFFFAVLVVSASLWSLGCLFPGRGVCRRVRDFFSSGLSVAAWSLWAAYSGWASSGLVVWSLAVLIVGPLGVANGVAWRGGLPPSMESVCGFAVGWPSLLLSSDLSGWRVCTRGVERAARLFPVRDWVCFPPFPVVFCLVLGGHCLFLSLPSVGRCMHWSVSGVANWLAVRVAGGRGPCHTLCVMTVARAGVLCQNTLER